MTTLASDLIEETRRYLYSAQRDAMNRLDAAITETDTTLTFEFSTNSPAVGTYLAVDLEVMYVWSVSGQTATVERGVLGSTAVAHSDEAIIYINPRFSNFAIFQAINADIDDMCAPSNGLFQVQETTLQYNAAIAGYDMTGVDAGSIINILRVRHDTPGPTKNWPEIRRWQLKYDQPVADYPSTMTLVLYEAGWPGLSVRVTYSQRFSHLLTVNDDVETIAGLSTTMMDIPPLGAAARLSGFREVPRNFTESQSDARRATEVPPGAQLAGATTLLRLRQQRIRAEAQRLNNQYPVRRSVA